MFEIFYFKKNLFKRNLSQQNLVQENFGSRNFGSQNCMSTKFGFYENKHKNCSCVRPYKTIHNQTRPFETPQGNTFALDYTKPNKTRQDHT